jgi:hypothetical protein
MKFTVSKNPDAIKDTGNGGSGYINRSGVYDVVLNYTQIAPTKNGAYQINFNVTHNGMNQTLWGPILVNKDGNLNEITKELLNRLCVIAGMEDDQVIETETAEYPTGKDQKMTEMEVIPELCDLPVKMRIQMEYGVYNGEITERRNVRAFYREDGATAQEAASGEDIGRRLAIDLEKYADNITYNNDLTEEDVQNWIKQRSEAAKSAKESKPTPKAKSTTKRPLFSK